MSDQATLEILIAIRSELAGLNAANAALDQTTKKATGLGPILMQGLGIGSGMALATSAVAMLKSTFEATVGEAFALAQQIRQQSQALGMSAEAYQVLRYEFQQAGGDLGHLNMALTQQTRTMVLARTGVGAAADAYRTLGLNVSQLEQLSPELRLQAIMQAIMGASDQSRAFQAAGLILGERGLPLLLSALKNLATEGYDKLAAAAKAAGAVMSDQNVKLLADAKQRLDNFKRTTMPIAAGTAIGWAQTAMDWVGSYVANVVNFYSGLPPAGNFIRPPEPKPEPNQPAGLAPEEEAIKARLLYLQQQYDQVSGDGLQTEIEKRERLYAILQSTLDMQNMLLAMKYANIHAGPDVDEGTLTDAQLDLLKEKRQLLDDIAKIKQKANAITGNQLPAYTRIKDKFGTQENPMLNPDYLSVGQGLGAGAMSWATSLGSQGQQIAGLLQNTLGQTVSGISQGITGWITGTEKWGDSLRQIGSSILQTIIQTIVQIGIQWVVTQIMMAVAGKTIAAASTAALVPIAMMQSAIWAAPATLATIASWGGAAAAAPFEIAGAIGATEAMGLVGAKEGGYFPGEEGQAAGIFHGGEFVFSAPAVRALGAQTLGAMHTAALGGGGGGPAVAGQPASPLGSSTYFRMTWSAPSGSPAIPLSTTSCSTGLIVTAASSLRHDAQPRLSPRRLNR
ncbi:MAG: hypothetical protein ABSG50_01550 [Opitutaceae bacterium]|jgi:hypothetical protein